MHRYRPSTVLNECLGESTAKLTASVQNQECLAAAGDAPCQQAVGQKAADRLSDVLLALEEYEHNMQYPFVSRQFTIDLDDGVRVSYPELRAALKKVPWVGGIRMTNGQISLRARYGDARHAR